MKTNLLLFHIWKDNSANSSYHKKDKKKRSAVIKREWKSPYQISGKKKAQESVKDKHYMQILGFQNNKFSISYTLKASVGSITHVSEGVCLSV